MSGLSAILAAPISDGAPCGPDLDLEFDPDYSQFMARSEGKLPDSFFSFNRAEAKLEVEIAELDGLLKRAQDIRLLVLRAKFTVLNRDLAGFAETLAGIAMLLDQRWEDVHPQAEDGDFGLRVAMIEALDDTKHIILPLQHAPLIEDRRVGAVSFRTLQLAAGEVTPREGEAGPDARAIAMAFADLPPDRLIALHDRVTGIAADLGRIKSLVEERSGGDASISLRLLDPAVEKLVSVVVAAIAPHHPELRAAAATVESAAAAWADEPAAVPGAAAAPAQHAQAAAPAGRARFAGHGDVRAALAAVIGYYRVQEPASPISLLVRQAHDLVGKSFAEALAVLMPNQASEASVKLGGRTTFDVPVERLAELSADGGGAGGDWDSESAEGGEEASSDGAAGSGTAAAVPPAPSRAAALALLADVAAHMRATEPASPVALICEQARELAGKDFMALLSEFMPAGALRSPDEG